MVPPYIHTKFPTRKKFIKLWDKAKNYTGEPYDILDDQIRIFTNVCHTVKARPGHFHLLSGRAQTYHIQHVEWH